MSSKVPNFNENMNRNLYTAEHYHS